MVVNQMEEGVALNKVKQSFIEGAFILLAAGMINRLLGFIPRMTLPRIIGAEGVGLYQLGYPLLIAVLTIITGGIPIAVAKLVAEAEAEQDKRKILSVLKAAFTILFAVSIPLTIALWALAPWIATRLLTDERVYFTLLSMCPIVILVGISSVIRGYFQGKSNMIPTALSQVAETLVRSVFVLLFAYLLLPYGVQFAAAGAMGGVLFGELVSAVILLWQLYSDHQREPSSAFQSSDRLQTAATRNNRTLGRLLAIAIPVTGSKMVGSASYFLESVMIVQSLAIAGVATAMATAQYGMLQGMVMPILLLPGVLTYSLSVSLVPSLSEAHAQNDMRTIHKRLHQSIRLALVCGVPFVVIMLVLAEPLCEILYGDPAPGQMLKWMAPFALFLYVQNPLQATLQALDKPGAALVNTFMGAAVKLILIYLFAAKLEWGMTGAVIAICCNIALVTILHWNSVHALTGFSMRFSYLWKALVVAGLMATIIYGLMYRSGLGYIPFKFAASLVCGMGVYFLGCYAVGVIQKRDLFRLPWIGVRLARRFKP